MPLSRDRHAARVDLLVGRIALEQGFIRPEHLREAMAEQSLGVARGRKHPRPLGVILCGKRRITDRQMLDLTRDAEGRIAEEEGMLARDRFLGEVLVGKGIDPVRVDEARKLQSAALAENEPQVPELADILVEKGWASAEAVAGAVSLRDRSLLTCEGCGRRHGFLQLDWSKGETCPDCAGVLKLPPPPAPRPAPAAPRPAPPAAAVPRIRRRAPRGEQGNPAPLRRVPKRNPPEGRKP